MAFDFSFSSYLNGYENVAKSINKSDTCQFRYDYLNREDFNKEYKSDGWVGRKFIAIPAALWSEVIKTTYHLARFILLLPSSSPEKKLARQVQGFNIIRDLQESFGRIASLFNDQYG